MRISRKDILVNGLNNIYAERVKYVEKFTIITYLEPDIMIARSVLEEWENQGYIRIIKSIELCEPMEDCIELLSMIPSVCR